LVRHGDARIRRELATRKRKHPKAQWLPLLALLAGALSAAAPVRAQAGTSGSIAIGDKITVATYAERSSLGFRFGFVDGVMGGIRTSNGYVFFGSAETNGNCPGTPNTQGVYRLVPSPTNPTATFTSSCPALLTTTPGPPKNNPGNIGPFDRDYAGGGPVMRVTSADGQREGILLVYHAEYQWGESGQCGSAPCFFGTLGLAFSTDGGNTFEKLGQIVQPYPSRDEWIAQNPDQSLAIGDGPFVLGDAAGTAVNPSAAQPSQTYIYLYYIDQDDGSSCGQRECLAVARARESDVIDAAFARDTDAVHGLFEKYYKGSFSEPAATGHLENGTRSGHFTPVLNAGFSPSALYDQAIDEVILATQAGNDIALRASANLIDWSAPAVAMLDEAPGQVRYPSLIGDVDGAIGGKAPYLFYTYVAPGSGGAWPRSTFMARVLGVYP
jgi:hypothetical protein